MSLFKKIKFMEATNLPSVLSDEELYAVNFSVPAMNGPDFERKVELKVDTNYIVGEGVLIDYKRGYLMAGCTARSDDSAPNITIRGITAILMGYDGDYGGDLSGYCISFPVTAGDDFKITRSAGTPVVWFLPTRE